MTPNSAMKLLIQLRHHYHHLLSGKKSFQIAVFLVFVGTSFLVFSAGCTRSLYESGTEFSISEGTPESSTAKESMLQGMESFQRGDFENAIFSWMKAAQLPCQWPRQKTRSLPPHTHVSIDEPFSRSYVAGGQLGIGPGQKRAFGQQRNRMRSLAGCGTIERRDIKDGGNDRDG